MEGAYLKPDINLYRLTTKRIITPNSKPNKFLLMFHTNSGRQTTNLLESDTGRARHISQLISSDSSAALAPDRPHRTRLTALTNIINILLVNSRFIPVRKPICTDVNAHINLFGENGVVQISVCMECEI